MSAQAIVRPILLVEDNPMDVDLTLKSFQEQGLVNPIVVCRDGEEALQYMEAHEVAEDPALPALVLLDLRLPKVDGLEVLRKARQNPVWKAIVIVVLTTSRQSRDIESAYALGANSYIVKPVDLDAFVEVAKAIELYWMVTNEPPYGD